MNGYYEAQAAVPMISESRGTPLASTQSRDLDFAQSELVTFKD